VRGTLANGVLAVVLVLATGATAGGNTVRATLSGKCTETDTLDSNGALKSASIACTASASCACAGSTQLAYAVTAVEPGNGDPGREAGTLTASGPAGTLSFRLSGTHSAVGGGSGTWRLVKAAGYKGVQLTKAGTYTTTNQRVRQIPQSMTTIVKIAASLSCWRC
jgi:hypothetical protein